MIRIFVVDDHPLTREGLKQIFAHTEDLRVVGDAPDGQRALKALRECPADLVTLDLSMPGIGGVDLIRRLHAEHPALRILVLSMYSDSILVSRLLKAGANGYLSKGAEINVLFDAVRKVARGGRYVPLEIMEHLLFEADALEASADYRQLSEREFQILGHLGEGLSVNEIAAKLCISPKTVSTHKTRLMQKLHLRTNHELIRHLMQHRSVPDCRGEVQDLFGD